jgi:hypothetical protein
VGCHRVATLVFDKIMKNWTIWIPFIWLASAFQERTGKASFSRLMAFVFGMAILKVGLADKAPPAMFWDGFLYCLVYAFGSKSLAPITEIMKSRKGGEEKKIEPKPDIAHPANP